MPRLTLIRHAETKPAPAGSPDHDRTLTDKGQADCGKLGPWIAEQLPAADYWLVSSAKRAQQTADLLLNWQQQPKPTRRDEPALYHENEDDIIRRLNDLKADILHAVVIAHNPCISYLAFKLTGQTANLSFPPLGLSHLQLQVNSWLALAAGTAACLQFVRPDQLA